MLQIIWASAQSTKWLFYVPERGIFHWMNADGQAAIVEPHTVMS